MKYFLLVALVVIVSNVFAQTNVYHPFAESDALWYVEYQSCCWSSCAGPPNPNPTLRDESYSYYMQGDTNLNGFDYDLIYKSDGWAHDHCVYGPTSSWSYFSGSFTGYLRQDTVLRQVFFVDNSTSTECVLYDFSLNVGDTVMNACYNWDPYSVVSSIDSILIGSTYRKRLNFVNSQVSIIEGIGSTAGLFEPIFPFEQSGVLVCYSESMVTLYPDTVSQCDLITSTAEAAPALSANVYPNPFIETCTIEVDKTFLNGTIEVYDALGKSVVSKPVRELPITLGSGELKPGMHLFRVTSPSGSQIWGKVFVE